MDRRELKSKGSKVAKNSFIFVLIYTHNQKDHTLFYIFDSAGLFHENSEKDLYKKVKATSQLPTGHFSAL